MKGTRPLDNDEIRLGMLLLLSVICIVCFTGRPIQSQQTNDRKFWVGVHITCDENEHVRNLMESYIKRELRGLKDVDVTDMLLPLATPYGIIVRSLEIKNKAGQGLGIYAIGYVFTRQYNNDPILDLLHPDPEKVAKAMGMLMHAYQMPHLNVAYAKLAAIDEICQLIVADFDTQLLEKYR